MDIPGMKMPKDDALFRALEKSEPNSYEFRKNLRLINNFISQYRLLYYQNKNNSKSALSYIANKTANYLQSKVDYILYQKGIVE